MRCALAGLVGSRLVFVLTEFLRYGEWVSKGPLGDSPMCVSRGHLCVANAALLWRNVA
jgi:hypothetical protein